VAGPGWGRDRPDAPGRVEVRAMLQRYGASAADARPVADASSTVLLGDQAADQPGGTAGPITSPMARRDL
jgi:hypothetical protein